MNLAELRDHELQPSHATALSLVVDLLIGCRSALRIRLVATIVHRTEPRLPTNKMARIYKVPLPL
jgi:hypothetical protein